MQSRTLTVDGIEMRWEEAGPERGIPVVLVHGIPTSPALWREVVPRITGARCLAWEMVGYGASIPQGIGRDISVAAQARYLAAWMAALEIGQAVLVGHDLGGGVVQIAAVNGGGTALGLVLTNAIGYDSWPIPSVKAMQMGRALLARTPEAMLKATMSTLYARGHDNPEMARAALEVHWPHYAAHGAGPGMARQVAALDVNDTLEIAPRLRQLNIPARIVWGTADQFQKIAYGERFSADLDAPLVRIEGGKHFTPEDHPQAVADAVNDLLGELRHRPQKDPAADPLEPARAALAALSEVGQDDASEEVRALYADIKTVLRVPFVNYIFRVLGNDPSYLSAMWSALRPVAASPAFEAAATELRGRTRTTAAPGAVAGQAPDALAQARAFTESIDYVLPKLLLLSILMQEGPAGRDRRPPAGALPEGVAEGTQAVEMVSPQEADSRQEALLAKIAEAHGHPKPATYFRALARWPDLLEALWARLAPGVSGEDHAAARAGLIGRAHELARAFPTPAVAPPPRLGRALPFFTERLIPDLMLDIGAARCLLAGGPVPGRNRFDLTDAGDAP